MTTGHFVPVRAPRLPRARWAPALAAALLLAAACDVPPDVSGSQELDTTSQALVTTVANINFQTAAAAVPAGYLVDSGAVFGARSGGLSYGWNIDNAANARDRNSTLSADKRYDTLNHMQKTGGATTWELAIANGTYSVHIVSGDATAFNSVYKIAAEGVLVVNGTPTDASRWVSGTATVTVNDGRLTLTNASGATNNKICFIDVTTVDSTPGALAASPARLIYTDVSGGAASATQSAKFSNGGSSTLTVSSLALSGTDGASYAITSAPALPATLAPGASLTVQVAFNPTTVGVKKATLTATTSAAAKATVALRGLSVVGTGGSKEPSLQRILDTYDIPVQTGDVTPDTTDFPPSWVALAGEEVSVQRFVSAGTGKVTIEPLAAFGVASTPVLRLGWYPSGAASSKNELFTIASANAQQLAPPVTGTTSFDPAGATFGFYTVWPSFSNREVFSEDALNRFEPANARHHVRVYQLRDAAGQIEPNAFIVTYEEFLSSFDFNDVVFIVRNVMSASAGVLLALENRDGVPFADRLVTSRLLNDTTGQVFHNRSTLRIHSPGTAPFTVTSLTLSGPFTLASAPVLPFTLAPGATADVTVDVAATGGTGKILTGSLTIATNGGPASTLVSLSAARTNPEGGNEPSFQQVADAFGYKTVIVGSGQTLNKKGHVEAAGDEVISAYWHALVPGAAITVNQLAAYHSRGGTATLRWFSKGSTTLNQIVKSGGTSAQSLLPLKDGSATDAATGSFSNGGTFGFKVDGESSDPTLNDAAKDMANGCVAPCGHHVRFWPAKNRSGAVIPGAYLMGMDYSGINYDYQDNIYLIGNIRPD
jgi:hypothetical protein